MLLPDTICPPSSLGSTQSGFRFPFATTIVICRLHPSPTVFEYQVSYFNLYLLALPPNVLCSNRACSVVTILIYFHDTTAQPCHHRSNMDRTARFNTIGLTQDVANTRKLTSTFTNDNHDIQRTLLVEINVF